jgi:DNA repair protein RecO (recombination protein O)
MPLKESEAIVLRSYPFREADLLVSFFTRTEGKMRGVARHAKKSRQRFGGALEPLTRVRVYWEDRERQELARIESCDVLASPLSERVDYPRAIALAHVAEVLDEVLPDREANDAIFRLASAVLPALRPAEIWAALTYFDLWIVRLTGFLPELSACVVCGAELMKEAEHAYFHPLSVGLMCADDKRAGSSELAWDSRAMAHQMLRAPLKQFNSTGEDWSKKRCADLRRFLVQRLEQHIEKKLVTVTMLSKL